MPKTKKNHRKPEHRASKRPSRSWTKRIIEHAFYDDGRIYQEVPFVGDKIDGAIREWHPNGMLAWEIPHRRGLKHGVCKQWNDQGVLLGTYEAKDGTGPSKCWHSNGQLKLEMFTIGGVPNCNAAK